MQKKILSTLGISFTLLISGCSTTPEVYNPAKSSGSWTSKAQVTDIKTGKSQQVSMDILGVWPQQLRIDVSATLGIAVASMTVNQSQFQMVLPRQKKFYQGNASEKSLLNVFKMPVNPKWILNMCFDQPIKDKGWVCHADENNLPAQCARDADHMIVTWSERAGEKKRVTIANSEHEVQIVFKGFEPFDTTKVQSQKDPFVLTAPDGFSKYNFN